MAVVMLHGEPVTLSNIEAFERAQRVVTRGAASAARVRRATHTVAVASAEGACITDVEGREYLDFMLGLGPVILEHRPPAVVAAVEDALARGIIFGGICPAEAEFAERIIATVPSVDVVAFASTGSEAVHLAVRLAQAKTGRRQIVKFDGHYHGWSEPLFVNTPWMPAVSQSPTAATHSVSGFVASPDVTVAHWHDLASLESALAGGPPVAAVFMEPIPCNFGAFAPTRAYMEGVRELCDRYGALLVFDEVLTGFRVALGGAQERLGALPDLTVMSKALASGFPVALVGGTRSAMEAATEGAVRPGGTFSGSPLSVAAGIATLDELTARKDEIYPRLDGLSERFAQGIRAAAARHAAPLTVNNCGAVLQLFWGIAPPTTYAEAVRDDRESVARLTALLLNRGIHVAERGLILLCAAHTEEHIDRAVSAIEDSLRELLV
jgi:glutamate-1-semialdehyde 2,1-aminomutase